MSDTSWQDKLREAVRKSREGIQTRAVPKTTVLVDESGRLDPADFRRGLEQILRGQGK